MRIYLSIDQLERIEKKLGESDVDIKKKIGTALQGHRKKMSQATMDTLIAATSDFWMEAESVGMVIESKVEYTRAGLAKRGYCQTQIDWAIKKAIAMTMVA